MLSLKYESKMKIKNIISLVTFIVASTLIYMLFVVRNLVHDSLVSMIALILFTLLLAVIVTVHVRELTGQALQKTASTIEHHNRKVSFKMVTLEQFVVNRLASDISYCQVKISETDANTLKVYITGDSKHTSEFSIKELTDTVIDCLKSYEQSALSGKEVVIVWQLEFLQVAKL